MYLNGCGMGPLLALVSPCFRETVVVIVTNCHMQNWVFLCSLDNLIQKNVIVFFLENQISKWRSFEKGLFLTYFSHFLVTREKLQKFLWHVSHSHTYMYFAHPIDIFCLSNFEKKNKNEFIRYGFSLVWDLVLILICAILEQSINKKWWAKFKLGCLLMIWICIYTNAKFIVICKPRTLNDGGEDSVKYRNRKKVLLLSSSHFAFYR